MFSGVHSAKIVKTQVFSIFRIAKTHIKLVFLGALNVKVAKTLVFLRVPCRIYAFLRANKCRPLAGGTLPPPDPLRGPKAKREPCAWTLTGKKRFGTNGVAMARNGVTLCQNEAYHSQEAFPIAPGPKIH